MTRGYTSYHYEKKPILAFYERGPGPAAFKLPPLVGRKDHALTHRINPEYTFGLKSDFIRQDFGPGAAAYLIPQGLKTNGYFEGYKYTCRKKFPIAEKGFIVPPPNSYTLPLTNVYKPRAPTACLGIRTLLINKRFSPGPAAYLLPPAIGPKIPDKLAAAEVTLKGSRKDKDVPQSPGPIYNVGPGKRSPAFTIGQRFKDRAPDFDCGPYAPLYPPPCPCKTPKRGSALGIRYNDYTGIFRTCCDKQGFEPLD